MELAITGVRPINTERYLLNRYRTTRRNAKLRGLPFEIPYDYYREGILEGKCQRTNIEFVMDEAWPVVSPSLDRIDSSKGYTLDNVQFVVWMYNAAKHKKGTDKQLLRFCMELVRQYLKDNLNE